MPTKPKRICMHPGCSALVDGPGSRCDKHRKQISKQHDQHRGNAAQRGYDSRWRKYRLLFLKENPLCVECMKLKRVTPATVVDHITPHKGDYHLFWDINNHQALCKQCHDKKTAREDGGFGNRVGGE